MHQHTFVKKVLNQITPFFLKKSFESQNPAHYRFIKKNSGCWSIFRVDEFNIHYIHATHYNSNYVSKNYKPCLNFLIYSQELFSSLNLNPCNLYLKSALISLLITTKEQSWGQCPGPVFCCLT